MILNEFSKYLQAHESEIAQNKRTITFLGDWLREILLRAPMNNVEKIIHCEIALATNKCGDYLLVAKSDSGRKLTNALYNFALSYEQHVINKWLQNKSPKDFEAK